MDKKKDIGKKIVLAVLLGLLISPLIQTKLKLVKLEELNGSFTKVDSPTFRSKDWFKGSYQDALQQYIEENIGFRNFFVRLNNQFAFWLFNEAKANDVVVGKSNYIFEENYIDSYFGRDYIGDSTIAEKTRRLKVISDSLRNKGKDIIVVIAPGKGDFYPEYIPQKYYEEGKSKRNYDAYVERFKKNDIAFIDFNDFFKQNKGALEHSLYTKGGIHWSYYGEVLVADSIIKYVEKLRDIRLPQLKIDRIETSYTARKTDNDAEKGMNLLFDMDLGEMAYPIFEYQRDTNTSKLKAMFISDSFFWSLYGGGFSHQVFDDGQFWYYNRDIYQPSVGFVKKTVELDSKIAEVEKNDLIVLMLTEANLDDFAFNFIDLVYAEYSGERVLTYDEKVEKYRLCIVNNPEWLEIIKKSAIEENITLEEQILSNARYMVSMENK